MCPQSHGRVTRKRRESRVPLLGREQLTGTHAPVGPGPYAFAPVGHELDLCSPRCGLLLSCTATRHCLASNRFCKGGSCPVSWGWQSHPSDALVEAGIWG